MQQPRLAHYPPGVSAEISAERPASLAEPLDQAFRTFASRDAAICVDSRLRLALDQIASERPLTGVCAPPLYQIFALTICYLMGARLGMMNVLIPNPRDMMAWSERSDAIDSTCSRRSHAVPCTDEPRRACTAGFFGLVVSIGGGMAIQQATAEKWLKVTGLPGRRGLGLSETLPVATSNRLDRPEFTGTIGLPGHRRRSRFAMSPDARSEENLILVVGFNALTSIRARSKSAEDHCR